jgi:DUF4097 and DUF4098 domain-containing protein YvlB
MDYINTINQAYHLIAGTILTIGMFGTSSLTQAEESKTVDLSSDQQIDFNLKSGGSIKVESWDKEAAEISYSNDFRGLDDYDISIDETGAGIEISSNIIRRDQSGFDGSNLLIEMRVPRRTSIHVNHSAGGSIHIDGLEGTFSGRTDGGEIKIVNSSGSVDLSSGGGEILVKDSTLDGEVRTGGGEVLVENVVGNFNAYSGGGNVVYRNVRRHEGEIVGPDNLKVGNGGGATVLISSAGGRINVPNAMEGANVSTGGGNIRIRNASLFVFARTGGGDISIEQIEGKVEASTGAGDIDIKLSRDNGADGDISITSGLGDIWLTIPVDFSMKLNVELGFTRNSRQNFLIDTKLDVDTEQSKSWSSRYGSPRKIIYGKANLNGGLHNVNIRTTNGNVYIIGE